MQSRFLRIIDGVVIGLWLLVPAVVTAPPFAFWTLVLISKLRIEPFSFILALFAILQVLVIALYRRQKKDGKTLFGILLLGWCIQTTAIAIAWNSTIGLEAWPILLFVPLACIAAQAAVGILYALLHLIGKKHPSPFFRRYDFPLLGTLVVSVLMFTNLYTAYSRKHAQDFLGQKDSSHDISAIPFRTNEKNTQLGRLPRPLRIFQTSSSLIGLTLSGEKIPLPFFDALGTADHLFLDIFSDKAYVVREGVGFVHDIMTKTTTALPAPVQDALQEQFTGHFGTIRTRRIIGAHGYSIALAHTDMAGTGDVAVYDVRTGEKTFQTVYLGYDQNRIVLFWINGKSYRLFFNVQRKSGMAIYLDENGQPYHRLSDDEMMQGIGKVAFSLDNDWFFKDKTPILEFQTAYPDEEFGASKFSIRNMYWLDDGRIAVEIERNLVVINLANTRGEIVEDQRVIQQLLQTAVLLSSDDENGHRFLNSCGDDTYADALSKEEGTAFVFCLK